MCETLCAVVLQENSALNILAFPSCIALLVIPGESRSEALQVWFIPYVCGKQTKSLQKCVARHLTKGQKGLSGNMSDFMPSRWLSSDYEGNKEIVLDVYLKKNRDQEELRFRNLEEQLNDIKKHQEKKRKQGETSCNGVLDVYLNKNRDQEELRFRNLEEIFNYLTDLDEESWHQIQSLLKNKILHLEGHSKSAPEQLNDIKKHQEKKRKEGETSCNRVYTKKMAFGFSVLCLVLCIIFVVLFHLLKKPSDGEGPHPCHTPPCPTHWFWYQGMCYYFSEGEKNWTSSQDFCFSHNASLARITKEETDFIHLLKGKDAFWIGLRRSPGQPWTWLNGDIATIDTAAITISIPSCLVICREVERLSQDSLIRSSIAGMKVGGSWRWWRLCLSGQ